MGGDEPNPVAWAVNGFPKHFDFNFCNRTLIISSN